MLHFTLCDYFSVVLKSEGRCARSTQAGNSHAIIDEVFTKGKSFWEFTAKDDDKGIFHISFLTPRYRCISMAVSPWLVSDFCLLFGFVEIVRSVIDEMLCYHPLS